MSYKGSFCIHNILFNIVFNFLIAFAGVNLIGALIFYLLEGIDAVDTIRTVSVVLLRIITTVGILFWSVHSSAKNAAKNHYVPGEYEMKRFCCIYFGIFAGIQVLYTVCSVSTSYLESKKVNDTIQTILASAGSSTDFSTAIYLSLGITAVAGLGIAGAILYMIPYTCKIYKKY